MSRATLPQEIASAQPTSYSGTPGSRPPTSRWPEQTRAILLQISDAILSAAYKVGDDGKRVFQGATFMRLWLTPNSASFHELRLRSAHYRWYAEQMAESSSRAAFWPVQGSGVSWRSLEDVLVQIGGPMKADSDGKLRMFTACLQKRCGYTDRQIRNVIRWVHQYAPLPLFCKSSKRSEQQRTPGRWLSLELVQQPVLFGEGRAKSRAAHDVAATKAVRERRKAVRPELVRAAIAADTGHLTAGEVAEIAAQHDHFVAGNLPAAVAKRLEAVPAHARELPPLTEIAPRARRSTRRPVLSPPFECLCGALVLEDEGRARFDAATHQAHACQKKLAVAAS